MQGRVLMGVVALVLAFAISAFAIDDGAAFDATQYPDWKGQWMRLGSGQGAPWDPAKPWGPGQQAPLTPEYQAIFEANLRDQAAGGQGTDPSYRCMPTTKPSSRNASIATRRTRTFSMTRSRPSITR